MDGSFLENSDTKSTCVWKGTASYYNVRIDGESSFQISGPLSLLLYLLPSSFPLIPSWYMLNGYRIAHQGRRLVLSRPESQIQALQRLCGVLHVCPADAPSKESAFPIALVSSNVLIFLSLSPPEFFYCRVLL